MKRTTLLGSVAAGLMAAAVAAPAWAQATTYPAGTDCSALSSAASRAECTNQMNESRQLPNTGQTVPDPDGTGNIQPGAPASAPAATPETPDGSPATTTPGGAGTGSDNDGSTTN